jgi:YbbR domain-containing protein
MAIIKLSAVERRRLSVFFTCLVLSALAWFFTTLSNPYNYTVKRVLVYKNIPQKRAFHSLQSDTIQVTVSGTGWQMLFSKMNDENRMINVDLEPLSKGNTVMLNSQIAQIPVNNVNHPVIAFSPDTLYFDFLNRSVRRVPIKLQAGIKYQPQFAQSNNVALKPAYVTLEGPSNRIDSIKQWLTDSLIATNVNGTIRATVGLQHGESNISVYPKSVDVVVPVDEFTEKTLEIPVKLVNNNDFYNVTIFPQKVKVTFITSLKRYAETNEDFFEAESDLSLWKDHGYSMLPVKLTTLPPFCRVISVEPSTVDFIVKK